MSEVLPEAIHGAWYLIKSGIDPHQLANKGCYQVFFGLDGSFMRYGLKDGRRQSQESGDYTFDGSFLILRGRNTDTYRVTPSTVWRWELEDKKDPFLLVRGRLDESDFVPADEDAARDVRILPIRASIENPFGPEAHDALMHVVYREGGDQLLATLFYERIDDRLHVGVLPVRSGLDERSWQRIVVDSFYDLYLGKPEGVSTIELQRIDLERRELLELD